MFVKRNRTRVILMAAVLFVAVISVLFLNKKIRINPMFAGRYKVAGVDVSHYQGTIDWEKLAGQNLEFAYIKATEGSGGLDERFYDNWQAAGETDLYIGAYHFFSFDSDGKKQAEFYIDTAGSLDGKMAPMVDVEFYGDKRNNPPEKEEVTRQLGEMLQALEEYYKITPIIYTTRKVYRDYIKGEFEEYPLWIRNVYCPPLFTAGDNWTFWQYTDTAVLDGYEGPEKYIDRNVFRGTREELEELIVRWEDEETVTEAVTYGDSETAGLIATDNRGNPSELRYTDEESFLEDFGFDNKEPFYQYCDENGNLQLELYYDEPTGRGCGIRYDPDGQGDRQGFVFNGSKKNICNPESVQERPVYENCHITEGSQDYYYIYQGEERVPSYCLVLDHNPGRVYAELMSVHDVTEDEAGKQYGVVGPDLSDNNYVKAAWAAGGYGTDSRHGAGMPGAADAESCSDRLFSHTYAYDYDGDGYCEAFVIIGDYLDMWGDVTQDEISGDAWFVDYNLNVTSLGKATFRAWQEYIRQDGRMYLLLNHEVGLPWTTDIYTVRDNAPVICTSPPEVQRYRFKYLNGAGQVIQIQDAYDGGYDMDFGWSGHTWKPYIFEFDHGELKEIGAKEVTLREVEEIASLPVSFDTEEYDDVQFILRDNGELNINTVSYDAEFEYTGFGYFTYYIDETGEWELTDEGPGIYRIQLDGESNWDYRIRGTVLENPSG